MKDAKAATERHAIAFNADALITRLTHLPVLLLKTPKADDVKRLVSDARSAMTRDIPLIMVTNALFFLGANLFFTSYTPFLKANNLTYLEITGLNIFITCINGLASTQRFSGFSKKGDPGMVVEFMRSRHRLPLRGNREPLLLRPRRPLRDAPTLPPHRDGVHEHHNRDERAPLQVPAEGGTRRDAWYLQRHR